MKKLSIEEKAECYDEVLEKAKSWHVDAQIDFKKSLENLFPELKESENEKTRKGILELVRQSSEVLDKQNQNDMIAWLEKQKELTSDEEKQGKEDVLWCINKAKVHAKDENEMCTCCQAEKWIEKQCEIDKASYEIAEKEKYGFVSGQFIECRKSFDAFKEDSSYWFEYVGNDTYIGRSDNILNQKFHITPRQLYCLFTQEHCPKESDVNEETNAPTGYGKYVDECLDEAAKHFFSDGEDKYSVADLFYAGLRCGKSWIEKQGEQKPVCGDWDEKIRKSLLEMVYDTPNIECEKIYGVSKEEALAWIEKQDKQPSTIRWYDMSLIPQETEELLVELDGEDTTWHEIAFYHADTKTFWNGTRQVEDVKRWCYVVDLLENQDEVKKELEEDKKIRADIAEFIFKSQEKIKDRSKWIEYLGYMPTFVVEKNEIQK